jgi:hypothetical protein
VLAIQDQAGGTGAVIQDQVGGPGAVIQDQAGRTGCWQGRARLRGPALSVSKRPGSGVLFRFLSPGQPPPKLLARLVSGQDCQAGTPDWAWNSAQKWYLPKSKAGECFRVCVLSSQIRSLRAPGFCKAYGLGLPLGRKVGLAHAIKNTGASMLSIFGPAHRIGNP